MVHFLMFFVQFLKEKVRKKREVVKTLSPGRQLEDPGRLPGRNPGRIISATR